MVTPCRWGIVGYGWVARDHMAPGIRAAGGEMAAVCDRDPAARARAEADGTRAHADLAGLLSERPDAVYVATPNHLHREAVEACAAAGVPVLCEKPLAATLADAEAMVAACASAGVLMGTAFDQRRHPAHRALRRELAAGRIGTVAAVRIVYACWLGRDWSAGDACNGANWRIDPRQAGGGAVIDLAPHGIDLVDALLGEPLVELAGLLQSRVHDYAVDDGGVLVGRTAGGVLAMIHNSYNTPEGLPRRRLEVVGSAGQLVATDTMGQTAGGSLTHVDGATGAETPVAFDAALSPFAEQARAFQAAVRGGPHDFDAARDLAGMRLLAGVYAAHHGRASFETRPAGAPQNDEGGSWPECEVSPRQAEERVQPASRSPQHAPCL